MKKMLLILAMFLSFNFSFGACTTTEWAVICDDGTVSCRFCHVVVAANGMMPIISGIGGSGSSGYIFHCCPGLLNYLSGFGYDIAAVCHCTSITNVECSTDSSGINGTANFGNDSMGQSIINRNRIFETGDWADDNMRKWEALEARALAAGFSNMTDFARANPGATPFDIFAIMKQIKCLDDGYYDNGIKPAINTMKESPENNNAGITSGKQGDGPKWPEGITPIDDGGVYIGNGTTPLLLRDKDAIITPEQAAVMRINSTVDTTRLITGNPDELQSMQDELTSGQDSFNQQSKILGEMVELTTGPGKDGIYGELAKFAGETIGIGADNGEKGFNTITGLVTLYGIKKSLSEGDKLGALSGTKDFLVSLIPDVLGGAVATAAVTGGFTAFISKEIGIATVNTFDSGLKDLGGTGILKNGEDAWTSIKGVVNEGLGENIDKLKTWALTPNL